MCTMETIALASSDGEQTSRNDLRKSNKPLMEKKRRQRINRCLNDLKTLVLEALKKDPSRYSKLEKADILEMTVRHVQALHRHETSRSRVSGFGNDRSSSNNGDEKAKYRAGFNQCAVEVTRYLSGMNGVPRDLHSKIVSHLNSMTGTFPGFQSQQQPTGNGHFMVGACLGTVIPPVTTSVPTTVSPVVTTAADSSTVITPDPSPVQDSPSKIALLPARPSCWNSLESLEKSTPKTPVTVSAGVTLIPARLANGQMALILPPETAIPRESQENITETLPGSSSTVVSTSDKHLEKCNEKPLSAERMDKPIQTNYVANGTFVSNCSVLDPQNSALVYSAHNSFDYSGSTHKLAIKQSPTMKNSIPANSEQFTVVAPYKTFEVPSAQSLVNLSTISPNEGGTLSPSNDIQENTNFTMSKTGSYFNQAIAGSGGSSLNANCNSLESSISQQDHCDSSTSISGLLINTSTKLFKPKPQLPFMPFSHQVNTEDSERSSKFNFSFPVKASHGTAFTSPSPSNQEPLNLVVTGDATHHHKTSFPLPPSSPSSSSSSSLSSSSSSPLSSPTSSSSSSSSLKAPSSLLRKRPAPYEVPRDGCNRDSQPCWRPW